MNNEAPIQEAAGDLWPRSWASWFQQVFLGLGGWRRTLTNAATLDLGSVAAYDQIGLTVTVNKAKVGDAVLVTPRFDTARIVYSGVVTSDDTVTVYAKNISAGAINPPSMPFRVIVFQN